MVPKNVRGCPTHWESKHAAVYARQMGQNPCASALQADRCGPKAGRQAGLAGIGIVPGERDPLPGEIDLQALRIYTQRLFCGPVEGPGVEQCMP